MHWVMTKKTFILNYTDNLMFVISKVVAFFLNPFVWIVLCLIVAWLKKDARRKKFWLKTSLVIFIIFSNSYMPKYFWYKYQAPYTELKPGEKYSAGILLGGFVSYDENNKRAVFSQASDRFIQAARLYKLGHISRILITGGNAFLVNDQQYNEADFVVRNLVELGIPSGDIMAEKKAINTIENALYTDKILDSTRSPEPYLLITSALHMPRAIRVFENEGMKIRPYACDFHVTETDTRFTWRSLLPSAGSFEMWNLLFKEIVGTLSLTLTQRKH